MIPSSKGELQTVSSSAFNIRSTGVSLTGQPRQRPLSKLGGQLLKASWSTGYAISILLVLRLN